MPPNPATPLMGPSPPPGLVKRLLGTLSIFTLVMTVPQALTIWVGHRAAGISILSWGAYLVSAAVWLCYGLQKRDKNIYLPCLGWIMVEPILNPALRGTDQDGFASMMTSTVLPTTTPPRSRTRFQLKPKSCRLISVSA